MIICVDNNQLAGSHEVSNRRKHNKLQQMGHMILPVPLPVADYVCLNPEMKQVIEHNVKRKVALRKMDFAGTYHFAIDGKKSLVEVAGNLCNSKSHDRVKKDLMWARRNGIHVIWLIENTEGVSTLDDLFAKGNYLVQEHGWKQTYNGQKWLPIHKTKVKCVTLAKILYSMQNNRDDYSVDFLFCKPNEAAEKMVELFKKYNKGEKK